MEYNVDLSICFEDTAGFVVLSTKAIFETLVF